MPPVAQACQALASDVANLEAADQDLRAQLGTLTGAAAWTALAQLGQGRIELDRKRADLEACQLANSAALQGTLVVIDVGPAPANPPTRVASLWAMGDPGAGLVGSSPVQAGAFAFGGPLPPSIAITVASTGDPDVLGPDFRSTPIPTAGLQQGAVRIEVVLGPTIRIEQADMSRWAASFAPTSRHLEVGGFSADLTVTAAQATLASGGIVGTLSGQAEIHGPVGLLSGAYVATATVGLVPSAAPDASDICYVVTVGDITIQFAGILSEAVSLILGLVKTNLEGVLTDHLRDIVRRELPTAVSSAWVLASLPPGVTTSIRRLSIDPTAIAFQPALGAVGTTLSTFVPPPIAPP